MSLATTSCPRPTRGRRPACVRRPLDEWRQRLAADYLPMARAMARPLKAAWPAAEDEFESAACMALVEAAAVFDPTRNVIFSTFAHHRIWGALRDVQRRQLPYGYHGDQDHAPIRVRLTTESEEHGRVLGAEPDDPVGWDVESVDAVEAWFRKLRPQHAQVCRLIFLHGKTWRETAKIMGISPSRVAFIKAESMDMLNGTWDARVREGA